MQPRPGWVDRALRILPLGEADRVVTGRRLEWWQEWLGHADAGDPYWDQLDCADAVGKVQAPVAMVTSWQDLFAPWQLEDWASLPHDVQKRLVIAPWPHEHPQMLKLYMREALGWLSQVLGEPSTAAPGPVRYYVTGAEEWRQSTEWPLTDTLRQAWYLQPVAGWHWHHLTGEEPTSYRFDPADPTPSLGGPPERRDARVRQDKIERRSDVRTFTSTPLDAPVEAIGNVTATIYLRSRVEHTDIVVRLCDVDPKGRSVNVCDGIQRGDPRLVSRRHRRGSHRRGSPVANGAPLRSRTPDPHPDRQRCLPTLRPQRRNRRPLAIATRLVAAQQEIFHDRSRLSHLTLPVQPR